jgi:predicted small lipoprotein YifL
MIKVRSTHKGLGLVTLLLAAVLSGCGQTGPLYLPEDQPPSDAESDQQ